MSVPMLYITFCQALPKHRQNIAPAAAPAAAPGAAPAAAPTATRPENQATTPATASVADPAK